MVIRAIDPDAMRSDEDWAGNNAAFTCPECNRVFIVSAMIHKTGRPCPHCGKSVGHVRGGQKSNGSSAYIEWPDADQSKTMTVQSWDNSTQEAFYTDSKLADRKNWRCSVRLGNGSIEVSYKDTEGRVILYTGRQIAVGHFELTAPSPTNGWASLYRFNGGRFLEGYWYEGDVHGLWRISLAR